MEVIKERKVYYPSENQVILVGGRAFVSAEPTHDYTFITTEVLWYNSDTGEFETKNSRYVPSSVIQ